MGRSKGSSGAPLAKKLGIKPGNRVVVIRAPSGFQLDPLPDGVTVSSRAGAGPNVILLFTTSQADLERRAGDLAGSLDPSGGLWVAWPKKASTIGSDLTFAAIQRTGLDIGLVDNKSCSIDDDWQALRFVYRLKDRPRDR